MAVTAETSAPYAPKNQIWEIIQRYRDRGNPRPLTSEALGRIGVPDSLIPRTLQALRVLDLVDENGEPTPTLDAIHKASSADFQQVLQDWLRAAYADVFLIVDPTADDETRIRDAFRTYIPSGQQGRMVSLFIGLCEEAGIRQKPDKKETASRAPRPKPSIPRNSTVRHSVKKPPANPPGQSSVSGLPPALDGLLMSLPQPASAGWMKEERDRFVNTFSAVLDFCYPVKSAEELETAEQGNDDGDD